MNSSFAGGRVAPYSRSTRNEFTPQSRVAPAGGLTIPDSKQLVRVGEHAQTGLHVRVHVRLDMVKSSDLRRVRDQRVVDSVMLRRQGS